MPKIALVRPPDRSFVTALGQKPGAPAIDMARAEAQHRSYAGALRDAGLEVVLLPPSTGLPDACFVQDVALVLPEGVILAWPAEPARQGEVAAIFARTCRSIDHGSSYIRQGPWNGVMCYASTILFTQVSLHARTRPAQASCGRRLRYGVMRWKHCPCRTGCICSAVSIRLAGRHRRRTARDSGRLGRLCRPAAVRRSGRYRRAGA